MRFLLDMGLSPRTAKHLREAGHDAVHLIDEHLERLPDPLILAKAADEQRIVVTFDLDFSHMLAIGKLRLPSLILFRLEHFTTEDIHRRLSEVLLHYRDDLVEGAIVVVDSDRLRVRSLPIE
jgi:predicted nuclease of predicted toxin-antitoxin system